MGDRERGGRGGRERDGPPERVNPFFVVDTGFVETARSDVCFEFQRAGRCSKGDACRFSHAAAAPPAGGARGGAAGTSGAGGAGGAAGPAKPWLASDAPVLVRGADGALELRAGPSGGAGASAGDGAAPSAKRKKDAKDKESKKERKRRKKEEKRARKDAKRAKKHKRSRSRSSSSSSSSSDSGGDAGGADAPPDASYAIVPITPDSYFEKNHEFSAWLRATRGVFFTSLKAEEARAAFRDFVAAWNARALPRRLYEGVQVTGRR